MECDLESELVNQCKLRKILVRMRTDWQQLADEASGESPRVRVGARADSVIRALYSKGWSYRSIADWLVSRGVGVSHTWVGMRVHALGLRRSGTSAARQTKANTQRAKSSHLSGIPSWVIESMFARDKPPPTT